MVATPSTLTRDRAVAALTAGGVSQEVAELVSGNPALAGSAAIWKPGRKPNPQTDRNSLAKWWQIEAYRFANIIGEARFAAVVFSNMAGRAELGISEPQTLAAAAQWVE